MEETLKSTPPTGSVQELMTIQKAMELSIHAYEVEETKYWPLIRQNVIKKIAPIKYLIKEIKDRVKAIDTRKQSRKKNEKPGSAPTVPNLAVSYLSDARSAVRS